MQMHMLFLFAINSPDLFVPWSDVSVTRGRQFFFDYIELKFRQAPGIPLRIYGASAERVVEAAGAEPLRVAGAGGHDQRQIARMLGLDKTLLQRRMQRLGNAALHKPRRRHDVIVANKRNRLIGADHLVGHFPGFP